MILIFGSWPNHVVFQEPVAKRPAGRKKAGYASLEASLLFVMCV